MDDLLLVSYFSKSGLWRKGIFDGGVSEINLNNYKITELISNLKQPHSPEVINNKICVLDSMGRNLFIGDTVRCSFPGFVRGLAFDGQYYYVVKVKTCTLAKILGEIILLQCVMQVFIK